MRIHRTILLTLAGFGLISAAVNAKPFELQHGERPQGWRVVGGNQLAWRFLNGALNSGNGDEESYENPSYFSPSEPGDMNRRDYVVEAKVRSFQENGTFTLLARFQDPRNYYGLEYRDRSRMGRVRLVKLKDGDIRYEKTVGHGFGYDNVTIPDMRLEPVRLRLEMQGNKIRALVNGGFEMVMEDGDFVRGTTGFANFFYHAEIQDFEVTDLVAPVAGVAEPEAAREGPSRIEFRELLTEDEASAIKQYLDSQRFANVEVAKAGDRWVVQTGTFPSTAQAQLALNVLEKEGVYGGEIVRVTGPTAGAASFVVVVAEYANAEDAALHRDSLMGGGYPDARVVSDAATGTHRVLVGEFTSEPAAREFAAQMDRAGFTTVGTMAMARPGAGALPVTDVSGLTEVLVRRVLAELGGGLPNRDQISDVLNKYSDVIRSMDEREQVVRNLEERIRQMTLEQEEIASRRQEQEKREMDRLLAEARDHLNRGELAEAQLKCNVVLQKDPYHLEARSISNSISRQELELARAEARAQREEEIHVRLGTARTLVAQGSYQDARIQLNTIVGLGIRQEELSETARREIDEARELLGSVDDRLRSQELDSLNRLAVQAGEKGDLDRQLYYLNEMLLLSPDDAGIADRVAMAQEALNRERAKAARSGRKDKLILYGLVIFVALFAFFYVLTWLLYRKQEERVEREELEVPQLTYEPATDNFQEEEPMFLDESVALSFGSVASPEAETLAFSEGREEKPAAPSKGVAVAEPPRREAPPKPGARAPAAKEPEAPEPEAQPPEAEEEFPPVEGPAPSRTESLEELFSEERMGLGPELEDLGLMEPAGEEEGPREEAYEPEPLEAGLLGPGEEETTEERAYESTEALSAKAGPAPALPEPVEGNLLFKQGFDDLEVGSKPFNWELGGGALAVEGGGQGGIGKCLRFRTQTGEEAYAHCRFPGIHNIFRFEFDLRAEPDIQGQIQVLIEHDEEAEGLVHLRATAGGSELLVQGVKSSSEPGQWRHIKFIINLDKQVVNGFVDGKLVAYKVSLPPSAAEVNSISIMGDASAAGSILIDNIKVYRV